MPRDPTKGLYEACSYCGKGAEEVRTLVSGPHVGICDECVALAVVIIRDAHPPVSPTWEMVVTGSLPDLSGARGREAAATYRLQVQGGWIVLTVAWPRDSSPSTSSQVFVPDPTGAWHLPSDPPAKP